MDTRAKNSRTVAVAEGAAIAGGSRLGVKEAIRLSVDNPFERYDIDPREGIVAITQRLKELAEDAEDEAERARIREAWEELTLHPARRLRAAIFAHPETREPLGLPPSVVRATGTDQPLGSSECGLRELLARPSAVIAIAQGTKAMADAPVDDDGGGSLADDPVLRASG